MKDFLLTLLHLAVTTAKLWGAGGVRAVIAENRVLEQPFGTRLEAAPALKIVVRG
jgi:hypothetical protein